MQGEVKDVNAPVVGVERVDQNQSSLALLIAAVGLGRIRWHSPVTGP